MSKSEQLVRLRALLQGQRWAALASLTRDGRAEASMVAYALSRDGTELYLHLSELAPHTRNLQQNSRASLVISETDTGHGDPQQLARATLDGTVAELRPEASDYPSAHECYLSRLPDAQPLFSFGDFHLFRFRIEQLRFVGGFGQAYRFQPTELELA